MYQTILTSLFFQVPEVPFSHCFHQNTIKRKERAMCTTRRPGDFLGLPLPAPVCDVLLSLRVHLGALGSSPTNTAPHSSLPALLLRQMTTGLVGSWVQGNLSSANVLGVG